MPTILVSVIVPCYNEATGIVHTVTSLHDAFPDSDTYRYELVFVDDHSTDETPRELLRLAETYRRLKVVRLGSNCGSHVACGVGARWCRGDVAVFLTADLQEGQELLERVLEQWRCGAKVVFTIPEGRGRGSWISNVAANTFYRLLRLVGHLKTAEEYQVGTRLMDRTVIDYYCRYAPRHHNMNIWMVQQPFPKAYVRYRPAPRRFGKSKWTFRKKLALAWNSLADVMPSLLTGWVLLGIILTIGGMAGAGWSLGRVLTSVSSDSPRGNLFTLMLWTASGLAAIGGLGLMAVGTVGTYLWRIYDGLRNGPEFTVEWTANLGEKEVAPHSGNKP